MRMFIFTCLICSFSAIAVVQADSTYETLTEEQRTTKLDLILKFSGGLALVASIDFALYQLIVKEQPRIGRPMTIAALFAGMLWLPLALEFRNE